MVDFGNRALTLSLATIQLNLKPKSFAFFGVAGILLKCLG
jgi:hypothetical protein